MKKAIYILVLFALSVVTVEARQTTSVGAAKYYTDDILREMGCRKQDYLRMVAEKGYTEQEVGEVALLISQSESEIRKGSKISKKYWVKTLKDQENKESYAVADYIGMIVELIEPIRAQAYVKSNKKDSDVPLVTRFSATKADYPSDINAEYQSFFPNWLQINDSYLQHVHTKACDSPNSRCPNKFIKY